MTKVKAATPSTSSQEQSRCCRELLQLFSHLDQAHSQWPLSVETVAILYSKVGEDRESAETFANEISHMNGLEMKDHLRNFLKTKYQCAIVYQTVIEPHLVQDKPCRESQDRPCREAQGRPSNLQNDILRQIEEEQFDPVLEDLQP